jgi:signal peptidase I
MNKKVLVIFLLGSLLGLNSPSSTSQASSVRFPALAQNTSTILFEDDFTSGNAAQWTSSGNGTWTVQSGEYVIDMGPGAYQLGVSSAGEIDWSDYIVEFDIKGIFCVDKCFEVRYTDDTHRGYLFDFRTSSGSIFGDVLIFDPSDYWHWEQLLPGVYHPNSNNTWYHITIFAIGPTIRLMIDDQAILSYTADAPYAATGKIAFWGWRGAVGSDVVHFDNVKVYLPQSYYLPVINN